jgi:hypothetical protein
MKAGHVIDATREFDSDPRYREVVAAIVARDSKSADPEVAAFLAKDFVLRWIVYRDLLP